MNSLPIITLQIDRMKHVMKAHLSQYAASLDEQLQVAVDRAMDPAAIQRLLDETARAEINAAVKEEVQRLFRHSEPGRIAIREAVQERMSEMFPIGKG